MASMVHSNGYADVEANIVDSEAMILIDIGFTDEQIAQADHLHISSKSGGTMFYWYSKRVPTNSEGHPIYEREKVMIRGLQNIRDFRVIAASGTVVAAMTLGKF